MSNIIPTKVYEQVAFTTTNDTTHTAFSIPVLEGYWSVIKLYIAGRQDGNDFMVFPCGTDTGNGVLDVVAYHYSDDTWLVASGFAGFGSVGTPGSDISFEMGSVSSDALQVLVTGPADLTVNYLATYEVTYIPTPLSF